MDVEKPMSIQNIDQEIEVKQTSEQPQDALSCPKSADLGSVTSSNLAAAA